MEISRPRKRSPKIKREEIPGMWMLASEFIYGDIVEPPPLNKDEVVVVQNLVEIHFPKVPTHEILQPEKISEKKEDEVILEKIPEVICTLIIVIYFRDYLFPSQKNFLLR
jgi:hypothetical protein